MPNGNHFWAKDEDKAVSVLGWSDFKVRYPDISYDAYRQRKGKLQRDGNLEAQAVKALKSQTLKPAKLPKTKKNAATGADYLGFTIGFFDIETTFSTQPRVLYAAVTDEWGKVERFSRDMFPGTNRLLDDKELVEAYIDRLNQFDILVSWNGKLFDIPVLNGRTAFHGSSKRLDPWMHIDLMYQASGSSMRIGRRSLESVSKYFGTAAKKTPLDVVTWDRAVSGDNTAYDLIAEHCDADVEVLRQTFGHLKRSIRSIHR
jgi:uncharacterized protein YprB with RNaseH-like and TPR domain